MVVYLPLPPICLIILNCCGLPLLLGVAVPCCCVLLCLCCLEVPSILLWTLVLWSFNVSADHYQGMNTFRQNLTPNLLKWCYIFDARPVLQAIVCNKVIKSNPEMPDWNDFLSICSCTGERKHGYKTKSLKKGIVKTECSPFLHYDMFKVAYLSLEGAFLPFKSILLGTHKDG